MSFFPDAEAPATQGARLKTLFGFVPRLFRLQGLLPDVVDQESLLLEALLGNEQHLSRRQKEAILLAISAARGSSYGVALHEQMWKLLGAGEQEAIRIVEGGAPEGPDGELVRYARKLTLTPLEVVQEDVDRLRNCGFDESQIIEAAVLIGFGMFFTTVQFGTGAMPDFEARPIPAPRPPNIPHPEQPEPRLIVEEEAGEPDPDAEWVRKVQAGDLDAFAVLVERHTQRVYRTLVGLLGNPDEARDAVQDTFLKAFKSLPAFERRARFSTWLTSIASNTGIQRLRDRKSLESLDDDGSSIEEFRPRQVRAWDDDPEQLYSKEQRRALVEQAIRRLPAKYRVVLMLRDVEQISTKDAAAALGLGVPALKARLVRGRLMLREALAPHFIQGAKTA